MDGADYNRQDFDVQKIMSNDQENTEWKKSSPLKTYSKKSNTPPSADGKSRYGRSHKPRMSGDFLSTDKKVSQYLKIDVDKQMHYFKSSPYGVLKSPLKSVTPTGAPRRGRPPKIPVTPVKDGKYQGLNEALRIIADNDHQAPPPTSTETIEVPGLFSFPRDADQQSDSDEVINENDWNVGDLAWASVGGYPYWPCAVTREPDQNIFRKTKLQGKGKQPFEYIHVRFFGDKGRRSWIVSNHIIPFHGLDKFQSLAEETCSIPDIKKKSPKIVRQYTIPASARKIWQAAVSEAESLVEASRLERVHYFNQMFPPMPLPIPALEEKPAPKKRGRKSKAELAAIAAAKEATSATMATPSPEVKKIKLEPVSPSTSYSTPTKRSPRLSSINIKTEIVTPPIYRDRSLSPMFTPECLKQIKEEPMSVSPSRPFYETPGPSYGLIQPSTPVKPAPLTPNETPKKKRGRPLGSTKKSVKSDEDKDFVPVKRKYEKKPKDAKPKRNSVATSKKKMFNNRISQNPSLSLFYERNVDRIIDENPQLSGEEVDKFVEKMWLETNPTGFRSRDIQEGRSYCSPNDSKSETSSRSNSPPPLSLPPSRTACRKGINLFNGIKNEKVCVVCMKNDEVMKCKGPCGLTFHLDCSDKSRFVIISENKEENRVKKKRGRRPRPSLHGIQPYINGNVSHLQEQNHRIQEISELISGNPTPDTTTPVAKKRGRPRKTPLSTPQEPGLSNGCLPKRSIPFNNISKRKTLREIEPDFCGFNDIDNYSKQMELINAIKKALCLDNAKKDLSSITSSEVIPSSCDSGVELGDSLVACKADEESDTHSSEISKRNDNTLLANLRGDSFESETSNNNLVVDDSSTDDRLMIEELPLQTEMPDLNPQAVLIKQECSFINSANSESVETDTNICNKGTDSIVRKISLDMPDLDFSESEDTMMPPTPQVEEKSKSADTNLRFFEIHVKSEPSSQIECQQSENKSAPSKLPEVLDVMPFNVINLEVNEKSLISTDVPKEIKQEDTNSFENTIEPPSSSFHVIMPAPLSPDNNSASFDDSLLFTSVKKEEKEVKMYSKSRPKPVESFALATSNGPVFSPQPSACQPSGTAVETEGKSKWMCSICAIGEIGPCFECGVDDTAEKYRCGYCNKAYHIPCSLKWPQCHKSLSSKAKEVFHCPQHVCHTCVSDNPKNNSDRLPNEKLVRCIRCPVTYHYGNYCIPAGSTILSNSQILCPAHYIPPKKHHASASWCMLCSQGGALICCDLCPNSFHLPCVGLTEAPQGSFYCEDCATGRFPLYGEVVWVKLGTFRWWPARILFPQEIPDNICLLSHVNGEFAVEFFGSHDYYWVNRGRCFLYHEGDGGPTQSGPKSRTDELYAEGLQECQIAFDKFIEERAQREASSRTSLKPPKYQKIVSNRLVGNVGRFIDVKSNKMSQKCDCDPNKSEPCGPDADCINRLLSVECDAAVCPAKENCCNRNFEKRCYPRLEPFKTESRGWGLKCFDDVSKGSFIIEYVGEMIDEDEYRKRLKAMQMKHDENFYFLTIDRDRMLDAGPKGNVSRFMNHSCDPNCETQKWNVNGDTRIGLFALENIRAGTELVFNYNLTTYGNTKVECKCGSAKCTGFIGEKNTNKQNKMPKNQTDEKKTQKKKRRKSKPKNTGKTCFTCGSSGELLLCEDSSCPKAYHLSCLGLTKHPAGGWVCPRHQCSVCSATKVQQCTLCINSYCAEHADGNISRNKARGLLCFSHNPSDSGSDWSEDRGIVTDEEEPTTSNKKPPVKRYSKIKIVNGHAY